MLHFSCRVIGLAAVVSLGIASAAKAGGFVGDSQASLTMRNFYFERDFEARADKPAIEEWAQGFVLDVQSGYSSGVIGLGLDFQANLGVKLDGSGGRAGAGLLPVGQSSGEPADHYSWLGLAAKAKVSASEAKVGTLSPMLPVILSVPMRLFSPSFRGGYLKSREFDRLTMHAGQMSRINLRNSTNMQKMRVSSPFGRFLSSAESDRFRFAGAEYAWTDEFTSTWLHARLEDIYRQDYLGFIHHLGVGKGSLTSDFRYFNSREDGEARAGKVDNQHAGLMLTYRLAQHAFGAGYFHQSGTTALPYIDGTSVHAHSEGALVSEYVNPGERTSQARYDHDFSAMGLHGLTGMLRYIHGENVQLGGLTDNGREAELGLELAYTVQSGNLKGLRLRARHAHYRSDFLDDANELRINIDYTAVIW